MAWKKWRVLSSQTTETSDSGTVTIDLPNSNILHTLLMLFEITNGATNTQGQDMSDVIDKIELIGDGSKVIASLEPETLKNLSLLVAGQNITETIDEGGGSIQKAQYPLFFGRDWFDPNFWLDLAKFTDLQLKIEYSPTIAATSFATGTFTHTVLGLMSMQGAPGNYQGTFRHRIIKNFTSAASGVEEVEPPQILPYAYLMVRAYEAGVADGTDINNVKFHVNNEERVYADLSWEELVYLNQSLWPVVTKKAMTLDRTSADTVNTRISRIIAAMINSEAAETSAEVTGITGDQLTLQVNDQSTQAVNEGGTATYSIHADETADVALRLLVESRQIPFSVFVPIADPMAGEFFDPTQWDEVTLELTQGGAGADVDVVLTEVAKY